MRIACLNGRARLRALCFVALGFATYASQAAPKLYAQPAHESPVRGEPDDLLLLAGYGLAPDDAVVYQALEDTTRPLHSPAGASLADSAGEVGQVPIVSTANTPYALTVRLPATLEAGQSYALWVRSAAGEWSNGVRINDARPLWATPGYVYTTASVASLPRRLKIVGRNLQPAAGTVTRVRLIGPETLTLTAARSARSTSATPRYVAEVVLPGKLLPGDYTVQLSRDGVSWLTLEGQKWTVRPDVPVPREFSPAAAEFGACRPDGSSDNTPCLLRAIEAARRAGGGAVVLGPGTWDFTAGAPGVDARDGVVLPQGVGLQGAGPAATRVVWHWNGAPPGANTAFTLLGGNLVRDITFRDTRLYHVGDPPSMLLRLGRMYNRVDPRGPADLASVADVIITHNVFDKPYTAIGNGGLPMRRIFITYNEFGAWYVALVLGGIRYNTQYRYTIDDTVVAYNTFAPGSYLEPAVAQGTIASNIGGALRLDFSHNVADGTATRYLYSPNDAHGWRAAFFWYMSGNHEMMLVSNNKATCTGDKIGDGEAFGFDGDVNSMGFGSARPVSGATPLSVAVQGALRQKQQERPVNIEDYYVGSWIEIVAGPGVGQLRKIESYDIDAANSRVTFKISTAWDVAPAAGASRIVVTRQYWQVYTLDNEIDQRQPLCQKGNRSRPKGGGISLWSQTGDSVVEGNRQYDTDGIILDQTYSAEDPACAACQSGTEFQSFVEIRGNLIDGEYDWSSDCSQSGIQAVFGASLTPGSPPPVASYGLSISHNIIRHADGLHGGAISLPLSWTDGPAPHKWPVIANVLVHHNVISDIAGAVPHSHCELHPQERVGINIDRTGLVWRTVLYRNSCMQGAQGLRDGGLATVRVCGGDDAHSCECP
jgi:hypothetical protein